MTGNHDLNDETTRLVTAYTVTAVADYIKATLESDPRLSDLTVVGEASGYRNPSSGHHYFSLRDDKSVIRCVMFRSGKGGEFLSDGNQVICHGRISMYPARGDMQFYVDRVEPDGVGALQKAFEELRKRLETEGIFDLDRKRIIPSMPSRIAVITSPTGAVIQDILNVLTRRYPLAELTLIPASVQGEKAAPEIVQAFQILNAIDDIDVAILARGGGSLEDLWPFNEESVARAIFGSNVPVVTGIGHETDTTIADYVADKRAPTPSAAAEIIAPDIYDLTESTVDYGTRINSAIIRIIRDNRSRFELALDRINGRTPVTTIPRQNIREFLTRAQLASQRAIDSSRQQLATVEASLNALGPSNILDRGYVIAQLSNGSVATSAKQYASGDKLGLTFSDGSVEATVDNIELQQET